MKEKERDSSAALGPSPGSPEPTATEEGVGVGWTSPQSPGRHGLFQGRFSDTSVPPAFTLILTAFTLATNGLRL